MFKKWIFNRYKSEFTDFLIEDLIGQTPDSINAPVFEILEAHKNTFQRWLVWNAWYLQKKLVSDENPEYLKGVLSHIRVLMALSNKGRKADRLEEKSEVEKPNPLEGVSKFIEGLSKSVDK